MLKRIFLVALAGLLMMPVAANAQYGFGFGDRTFTLMGSGTSDRDLDNSVISLDASVGYFWMDSLEASIRQNLIIVDSDASGSDFRGNTRVAADWYFLGESNFQPFIGANIGLVYGDAVKDSMVAGPEIGFKHFMNETTFLAALVEYQILFRDSDDIDDNFDDALWVYSVGIGLKF